MQQQPVELVSEVPLRISRGGFSDLTVWFAGLALLGLCFLDRLIGAVRAVAHHLGQIADASEKNDTGPGLG
jgi:hypothetical protein